MKKSPCFCANLNINDSTGYFSDQKVLREALKERTGDLTIDVSPVNTAYYTRKGLMESQYYTIKLNGNIDGRDLNISKIVTHRIKSTADVGIMGENVKRPFHQVYEIFKKLEFIKPRR